MSLAESPIVQIRSPRNVRRALDRLVERRRILQKQRDAKAGELERIARCLGMADAVETALDHLSETMFGQVIKSIEDTLSSALQEVLEQPLRLRVVRGFERGAATLAFHIERDGQQEDILRGQGGSVVNILSVGLRLLALMTLPDKQHRRFLVLDEQDCWLRPDLVPRLVKIVHDAGKKLGFQVLMISHHDVASFERYADKIYQCTPTAEGTKVQEIYAVTQSD